MSRPNPTAYDLTALGIAKQDEIRAQGLADDWSAIVCKEATIADLDADALTVQETGTTRIEDRIRLKETRPFRTDYRPHLPARKSIFNKVVCEPHSGGFELRFAGFLELAPDVQAFAKNYLAVGFKLDYVKTDGDLANYHPDFIVRTSDGTVWLVETKGRAELDLPQKMARLRQWCADATAAEENGQQYGFVFVDQTGFEKHAPKTFAALAASFTDYK